MAIRVGITIVWLTLIAALTSAAQAIPIGYEGTLTQNTTRFGEVSEGWHPLDANENTRDLQFADWWQFSGVSGETVTITVNRLFWRLDPALTVFRGSFTDTDEIVAPAGSPPTAAQLRTAARDVLFGLCRTAATCSLPAVGFADDTIDPFPGLQSGTLRDPQLTFVLPDTGTYSVLVWSAQSYNAFIPLTPGILGPFDYQITLGTAPTGPVDPSATIAEPATLGLFGLGLAGLGFAARRRKSA